MCSEHVCPKCGGKKFTTTAHVQQVWKVDAHGNFIDEVTNVQTTHGPDDDNNWYCADCGEIAVIVK